MRKSAAVGLVVVVLLTAMTVPAVALQGDGPPEHAEGDGPPEHAEGGDDGTPAAEGPSDDEGEEGGEVTDDGDGGGDATEGVAERAGDDDEAADSTDGSGGGDGRDAPTVTDGPTDTEDAGPGVTETITSLLPLGDEDDSTPAGSEQAETRTAQDDDAPIPTIGGDDDEPSPTPDDEDDPTPTPEDEPSRTAAGEDGTVTPSGDDADSGSADDGGGNPWSTVGSNDSDDSGPSDRASVEIRTNDSATVVEITGAEAGDTVEADLRGPATDGRGVAVESVAIEVGEDGSFTTAVSRPTAESAVESAPGVPVTYVGVESDAGVERATLTLDVEAGALPAGVAPADLAVLRYQDGVWTPVETTTDEESGGRTVETGGSGTFVVAAPGGGPIEVANVEVVDDGNGSGGERTVRATAENTGDRESTRTVAATVDGETVATRQVTLEPGEAATLAFDLPAGAGTVAVGGVEAEQHRAQGTDPGGAPAAVSTNGNLAFGVGAAVLVVLAAAGTGLLAARHEDWEP